MERISEPSERHRQALPGPGAHGAAGQGRRRPGGARRPLRGSAARRRAPRARSDRVRHPDRDCGVRRQAVEQRPLPGRSAREGHQAARRSRAQRQRPGARGDQPGAAAVGRGGNRPRPPRRRPRRPGDGHRSSAGAGAGRTAGPGQRRRDRRAAAAFGASGVVAIEGTANPFGWKALRGAHGQHLPPADRGARHALGRGRSGARTAACGSSPPCRAAARRCRCSICARPTAIVLGGEGGGRADRHDGGGRTSTVTIPMQRAGRIAQRRDRRGAHPLRGDAPAAGLPRQRQPQREVLMDLFADDEPPVSAGRTGRDRSVGAARRAHAAAHARRDRRPGRAARARTAAARGDRARPAALDHPLGPAGHRQDDAGARDRAARRARTSSRSAPCCRGSRRSAR